MGPEVLGAVLSADNDLIVDPALPLCGVPPLASPQRHRHAGVEQVVELPLTESEQASFHACCEGIRRNMGHLKEI